MSVPLAIGLLGGGALSAFGSWLGGNEASDASRYAADQQLRGMREAIAAQERYGAQARQDWMPFRELGLQAARDYYGMASNPNLDAIKQDYQEGVSNLQAQLAGIGLRNSGYAAKSYGRMAGDYAARMSEARMRAMQPLMSLGGAGAGGMAGASGQMGAGLSGAYQQGYGAYGQNMAQAGMYGGMGTSGLMGGIGNAVTTGGVLAGMAPGGYPSGGSGLDPYTRDLGMYGKRW